MIRAFFLPSRDDAQDGPGGEARRVEAMDPVKKHFEEEAPAFDQLIRGLAPFYDEMLDALVLAIPFKRSEAVEVIDLRCGTGTVAKRLKESYPKARITCTDLAEKMLEMARGKLGPDIRYQLADFRSYEFDRSYDIVISSLALHHLETDEDKQLFYGKILHSLEPGGVFYNADVILGSTDHLQREYMQKWRTFMRRNISAEEAEDKWIPMHYAEDRPAILMAQLSWLQNLGFASVDVIWKYYNFAVYGGIKS